MGRPPNDFHDRQSRPPPMELDRNRDFRGGDDFRGGPSGPSSTSKPNWSAPPGSRSPIAPPGPARRNLGPTIGESSGPFREEQRPIDMPLADPTRPSPPYDSRGSFSDRGRGRGGGRGFQRGGGMGRGRGRGEFGRFGPGGRGHNDFHRNESNDFHRNESNDFHRNEPNDFHRNEPNDFHRNEPNDFHRNDRDGPGGPPGFRSMESSWKPRPDAVPTPGDSRMPQDGSIKQGRDLVTPQASKQQPSLSMTSSDAKTSSANETKVVKSEPVEPVKTEPEEEKGPRPISPPPPGNPSGVVLALARLADLEAQMEYAYAKHMQLVKRQKELQLQAKVLETLPVGIEAFKEELEAATIEAEANSALYQ